jgi:hypothetical protein
MTRRSRCIVTYISKVVRVFYIPFMVINCFRIEGLTDITDTSFLSHISSLYFEGSKEKIVSSIER